jgi:hypothetical protein
MAISFGVNFYCGLKFNLKQQLYCLVADCVPAIIRAGIEVKTAFRTITIQSRTVVVHKLTHIRNRHHGHERLLQ